MYSSIVINKILDLNYKGFKEAYIRQTEDVNNLLKTLFIKGAICKEIKVLSEPVETIILKDK